jgi:hypothetical protein
MDWTLTMIASLGPGLPIDLLAATGSYAGPLRWDVDRATPRADAWLESKFPLWARSILESWAEGELDDLDLVVCSRADDAAQRLYYYVCELQRAGQIGGPEAFLLDIAKVPRSSSLDRTIAEVRILAGKLGLVDAGIEAALAAGNRRREQAEPVSTDPVCLLAGTPPPDRRLHAAIEAAGFAASGPTLADIWSDPGPPIEGDGGDPLAAIGRQLHARPDDQRGFEDHASAVGDRARAIGAHAAVLWYAEEDEARVWNLPAIRTALVAADVPFCTLTRRDWAARDGAPEEILSWLKGLPA